MFSFLKPLKIGKITAENNVFLAPMAAYTDAAFRGIAARLGAGQTFTELTSARGIVYGSPNTMELLAVSSYERHPAAQVFGSDPDVIRGACEHPALEPFDIVDINMGCPVPKIVKNGEGSALLKDVLKAEAIVKAAVKTGKTVTLKIRVGMRENEPYITEEFAKMAEAAGASLLTVHGRTRETYYTGEVHFEEIAKAKNAVKIPVIANGGIFCEADAERMIAETNADGVMLARGAVKDPFLFSRLTGADAPWDTWGLIDEQIREMLRFHSDRYVTLNMRKFFAGYFAGRRNAKKLCLLLYACETVEELIRVLAENRTFFDEL